MTTTAVPQPIPAARWAELRSAFDLGADRLHLSCNMLSSHPAPVREAIARHRAGLDANPTGYHSRFKRQLDHEVREAAAAHLRADPADVALTESTMMGLALLAHGIRIRPDQEILTTAEEYGSFRQTLRWRAERTGCGYRNVTAYDDPTTVDAATLADAVVAEVRPATRLIALTWVHSSTGVKLPVRRITRALDAINAARAPQDRALVVLDAVHGFGIENAGLDELGVDFVVSGTHKWLFGPRGTGLVGARPGAWAQVDPIIPAFGPTETPGEQFTPGGFHAFEHRWALVDAFRFHAGCDWAAVEGHTHALAAQLKDGLGALPGVQLVTPRATELSSGIVCFDVDGMDALDAMVRLRAAGCVATMSPYRRRCVRLAPGLVNSPAEVAAGVEVVRAVASAAADADGARSSRRSQIDTPAAL